MRRLFLPLLLLTFLSYTTQAQEVPEVQQSLITKVTATWCINCGTWGWAFFEDILADNGDKAIMWKAHYSGDLQSPVANNLASNFNVSGQPRFILNNTDQGVSSGNSATKRTAVQETVNANAELAPLANTGIIATLDGNTISVQTKTRFFQEASGDYFLGLYIVEDGVIADQSGQGNNTSHSNILRTAFTTSAFGEQIAEGQTSAGTEIDYSQSISVNAAWNTDNVKIVAIIWEKTGATSYEFVNGNTVTEFTTPVSVNTFAEAGNRLQVLSDFSADGTQFQLDLQQSVQQAQLGVYNLNGQLVEVLHNGTLAEGQQTFRLPGALPAAGYYIVRLETELGELVERFVVQ